METQFEFKKTIDKNDIDQVMRIVESFGANKKGLVQIRSYLEKELVE